MNAIKLLLFVRLNKVRIFTILIKKKNCQCNKRASSCAPPHLSAHVRVVANGAVLTWASGGPPSSLMSSRWLWPSTTISFLKRPPAGNKRQPSERHEDGVRRGDWWWWFVVYGEVETNQWHGHDWLAGWLISAKWLMSQMIDRQWIGGRCSCTQNEALQTRIVQKGETSFWVFSVDMTTFTFSEKVLKFTFISTFSCFLVQFSAVNFDLNCHLLTRKEVSLLRWVLTDW